MVRKLLPLVLLLAACSKGPQADLQYIKQARSLGAEWALVNEQARRGGLTPAYVSSMHKWLRDGLTTASSSLTQPNSRYAAEIQAMTHLPDDAAPEEPRARSERLKQIEGELESA